MLAFATTPVSFQRSSPARRSRLCARRPHRLALEPPDARGAGSSSPSRPSAALALSRPSVPSASAAPSAPPAPPTPPAPPALDEGLAEALLLVINETVRATPNLRHHERVLALSVLPSQSALVRAGRADLARRVRAAGGPAAVARATGLRLASRTAYDYADDRGALHVDLLAFAAARCPGRLPTGAQLASAGRLDLRAGIRAHGGAAAVASDLALKLQRGRRPAAADTTEAVNRLRGLLAARGKVPPYKQLLADGRLDLVRDVCAAGGRDAAARALRLHAAPPRTVFDEDFFDCDVCTSPGALEYSHDDALSFAEDRGGGGGCVLDEPGTALRGRRRRHHHYREFSILEAEIMAFIFDAGVPGVMPTAQELFSARRGDIVRAMALHGGQKAVADRLGLVRRSLSRQQVRERAVGLARNWPTGSGRRSVENLGISVTVFG